MPILQKWFSSQEQEEYVPSLNIDLHSHLIPNIDDGAKDMQESIRLLKALEEAGYYKVITTPHIMIDGYRNTREIIMEGLEKLLLAKEEAGIHLDIEVAAEYYLDEGFIGHIEAGNPLAISEEYILFETSHYDKPLQFDAMLEAIKAGGYKALMAHPERYAYINDFSKDYTELRNKGIYFQVNINSFGGHHGKEAQEKAVFLSEHGMIDFLGSDVHHMKQVKTLLMVKEKSLYKNIFKKNLILNNIL